jgi:uncharacterized damage-inducible protein DinB
VEQQTAGLHLSQEVALMATLRARDDLVRAVEALPADRYGWRPGRVSRTAIQVVAHCAATNLFQAAALSGAPLPYLTREEEERAVAACSTMAEAVAFLQRSVAAVCDAIVGMRREGLDAPMVLPWGERMPTALGLLSSSQHMHYHAGQVNLMQLLLGDDEQH